MRIGGLQKLSMVDYPGRTCAVVFTAVCGWRCWFCQNRELQDGMAPLLDEKEVLAFLEKRVGQIGGVAVSGGEPTMEPDLADFLRECRDMGHSVKLDTNGSRPDVVSDLLDKGLLDYVAVDLKSLPEDYGSIGAGDGGSVLRTIDTLAASSVRWEARITVLPGMDLAYLRRMATLVADAPLVALQWYVRRFEDQPEAEHTVWDICEMARGISDIAPRVLARV